MRSPCVVLRSLATVTILMAATPGLAHSDAAQETPERLQLLRPAVVEYRWTFLTPRWVVDARSVDTRAYRPALRAKRIDYGVLDMEMKRYQIGRIAEFSCKYSDFALPNACRTTWRDAYIDVPVPVVRHDYLEIDVPEWRWRKWRTTVDVPRLVWKEETLAVSLPALAVPVAAVWQTQRE